MFWFLLLYLGTWGGVEIFLPFFTDFNLTVRLTSGPLKIRLEQQGSLKLEIGGKINLRLLPSL